MKKLLTVLAALLLALSLSGCSAGSGKTKIAVVQPMEHTSLNQIRETIVAELKANGYDGDKAEIILKNANGDTSLLASIFTGLIADGADILIPIATGTAQAAAAATSDIPIVFSAVSNPVEAGLVESFGKTDKNITGVSNSIAIEDIFAMAQALTPGVKTFGFVYNAGEINSAAGIARAKAWCDANSIAYKEATVAGTADLQQAVASLVGSVDAFFTPNDNTVASAMTTYVQLASDAGLPVYCGADSMVLDGGLATVGIDYTVLGKQTAAMVMRILDGAKISDTDVEAVSEYAKMINVKTAAALGIEIPEAMKDEFVLIGE